MKPLLSYAFRPFFLLVGLFALLGIAGFLLMAVATWTQRPAWPCCADFGSPPGWAPCCRAEPDMGFEVQRYRNGIDPTVVS